MPSKYANVATRDKLARSVGEMEEVKSQPHIYDQIPKKEDFERRYEKYKKTLDAVTPPDLPDKDRDTVHKRIAALTEALQKGNEKYVPPMPSDQDMQRAPVGAVDRHMRWENFWKRHNIDAQGNIYQSKRGDRGAIGEIKDLWRVVAKGYESEAPNAANIEMIRPLGTTVALADSKLPISYGFSPVAKYHYDDVFPDHEKTTVERKVETAEQEKIRQLEAIISRLEKQAPKKKPRGRNLKEYTGPTCQAKRPNGAICGLPVVEGKNYCFSKYHKAQLEPSEPISEAEPQEVQQAPPA